LWLVVSARYFQTLGFYTELLDLPNDPLLDAIKNVWSLLKRSIIGSYHQVSAKHLDEL